MILNKVIKSYKSHLYNVCCKKYFSNDVVTPVNNVLQRLSERSLIKVKGDESVSFLQGLITNDMRHLEGSGSMYAMFLNIKGRVMFDSILYVTDDPKTFLIECDKSVAKLFQKHLKMYKVKRNIDIETASDSVWVSYDSKVVKDVSYEKCNSKTDNTHLPSMNERIISNPPIFEKGIMTYNDPRLNVLGSRILCAESVTSNELINHFKLPENAESTDVNQYRMFRYKLGVGEGIQDLPLGVCFPLEANADYLHGVSFHKGCYIGQELTARTHHTGVIRKRFMPMLFENEITSQIDNDTPVYGSRDSKTSLGKIRAVSKNTGLGLLRIAKVLDEDSLNVSEMKAKTYRPTWWPPEAPKEKMVTNVPE